MLILWHTPLLLAIAELTMERKSGRRSLRQNAKTFAKSVVNSQTFKNIDGGPEVADPRAIKLMERAIVQLVLNGFRPLAIEISECEARAFPSARIDHRGRYAIGVAMDEYGMPYFSSPACGVPAASAEDPPTPLELLDAAKAAAFSMLFGGENGRNPHVPVPR